MAKIKISKIERSKRKTIALLINADTTLTVKAPFLVRTDHIHKIIEKRDSWIKRKIREVELLPINTRKEYVNGEGFLLLGKSYRLKIGDYSAVQLGEYLFFPKTKKDNIQEEIIKWYKILALKKITSRANWYSKKMGVNYSDLKLSNAKKRWGSCGKNNNLLINWRIIMAPIKVIDYVIVHELAHIEQKNHSQRFWNQLKLVLSDYEFSRLWLQKNGYSLQI